MARDMIEPGRELVLETSGGSVVTVEAESEPWENSKGIEGFDATLKEDFGNSKAGDFKMMQLHIFDVIGGGGLGQCESCGTVITEDEAHTEHFPGADFWFCSGCADL